MTITFVIAVMFWAALVLLGINLLLELDDEGFSAGTSRARPLGEPPREIDLGVSFSERERVDSEQPQRNIQEPVERQEKGRKAGPFRSDASDSLVVAFVRSLKKLWR